MLVLVSFILLVLALPPNLSISQAVPHVSNCNTCQRCELESSAPTSNNGLQSYTDVESWFQLPIQDQAQHHQLPNCTVCFGCSVDLLPIQSSVRFHDTIFQIEDGWSDLWIFKAPSNKSTSGFAVVLVPCMPFYKQRTTRRTVCNHAQVFRTIRKLLAIHKLAKECGFEELIAETWIERVTAVVPGLDGYHIDAHAIWTEYVPSSVTLLTLKDQAQANELPPSSLLHIMQNLNKTQIVMAAIFDLLVSHSDRHVGNLLIQENGNIKLIDNEEVLVPYDDPINYNRHPINSIFVPTTKWYTMGRIPYRCLCMSSCSSRWSTFHTVGIATYLDYRCALPHGAETIGSKYPPQAQKCMSHIVSLRPHEVQQHYGLSSIDEATALWTRSADMLREGYEWTYRYGFPRQHPSLAYPEQPKCCQIKLVDGGKLMCAVSWHPNYTFAEGQVLRC